jgi:hypothetical protein
MPKLPAFIEKITAQSVDAFEKKIELSALSSEHTRVRLLAIVFAAGFGSYTLSGLFFQSLLDITSVQNKVILESIFWL